MKKSEGKKKKLDASKNVSTNRHRGKYARTKGHRYETQIVNELKDLGFTGCKTSRMASKLKDDGKIDIVDIENRLPISIQLKKVQQTPNYFKIREEADCNPEEFCIIWAKQEPRETNIITVGEVALISKQMLYKLIKPYAQSSD